MHMHVHGILNQFRALSRTNEAYRGVTMKKQHRGIGVARTNAWLLFFFMRDVFGAEVRLLDSFLFLLVSTVTELSKAEVAEDR
jgi:hypothetical protein